jgi:hypothetical protein
MSRRIDIDHLGEAELIDLNRRIVERLRFMRQLRAHQRMLDFSIGDRVSFEPPGRGRLFGVLTRYNKKTVTVITEQGEQWNVAPALLSRVLDAGAGTADIEAPRRDR